MSAVCPSCRRPQQFGILCADCCVALETCLAAVPQLVEQLDVAISKQSRIGSGGKAGKGSIHERNPINFGALDVRDQLLIEAAFVGEDIDWVRSHPQAAEMVNKLGKAVKAAYQAIDRLQERIYLAQCLAEEDGAVCHAEVWARPGAAMVRCTQCETLYEVAGRRLELLVRARNSLVTVREASEMMGDVGGIFVTQASIRGYIHRKRIAYRPGGTMIRLGDLLDVVQDEGERRSA